MRGGFNDHKTKIVDIFGSLVWGPSPERTLLGAERLFVSSLQKAPYPLGYHGWLVS